MISIRIRILGTDQIGNALLLLLLLLIYLYSFNSHLIEHRAHNTPPRLLQKFLYFRLMVGEQNRTTPGAHESTRMANDELNEPSTIPQRINSVVELFKQIKGKKPTKRWDPLWSNTFYQLWILVQTEDAEESARLLCCCLLGECVQFQCQPIESFLDNFHLHAQLGTNFPPPMDLL